MLLAIDAGNTNVVFAVHDGREWRGRWRIATRDDRTSDEYAVWLLALFRHAGLNPSAIDRCAIGTVVPAALYNLRRLSREWFSCEPLVARAAVEWGFQILVDRPKEVGADRIVNCLAAYHKYGTAAIVVDFGSSICVDVVSAKGEFLGGAIAPGVQVSSDAAAARSAALRRVELTRPRSVIGKNTVECMQAGAVFGFAALVDGLVNRVREDVEGFDGNHVTVVATGHTAQLVLPDLRTVQHYEKNLTLDGLRLVFERNQRNARRSQ